MELFSHLLMFLFRLMPSLSQLAVKIFLYHGVHVLVDVRVSAELKYSGCVQFEANRLSAVKWWWRNLCLLSTVWLQMDMRCFAIDCETGYQSCNSFLIRCGVPQEAVQASPRDRKWCKSPEDIICVKFQIVGVQKSSSLRLEFYNGILLGYQSLFLLLKKWTSHSINTPNEYHHKFLLVYLFCCL